MTIGQFLSGRVDDRKLMVVLRFFDTNGVKWSWRGRLNKFTKNDGFWLKILGDIPCTACIDDNSDVVFDLNAEGILSNSSFTTTICELDNQPAKKEDGNYSPACEFIRAYKKPCSKVRFSQKIWFLNKDADLSGWLLFQTSASSYDEALENPLAYLLADEASLDKDGILWILLHTSAAERFDDEVKEKQKRKLEKKQKEERIEVATIIMFAFLIIGLWVAICMLCLWPT